MYTEPPGDVLRLTLSRLEKPISKTTGRRRIYHSQPKISSNQVSLARRTQSWNNETYSPQHHLPRWRNLSPRFLVVVNRYGTERSPHPLEVTHGRTKATSSQMMDVPRRAAQNHVAKTPKEEVLEDPNDKTRTPRGIGSQTIIPMKTEMSTRESFTTCIPHPDVDLVQVAARHNHVPVHNNATMKKNRNTPPTTMMVHLTKMISK